MDLHFEILSIMVVVSCHDVMLCLNLSVIAIITVKNFKCRPLYYS